MIDPHRGQVEHAHRRTAFEAQGCGFQGLDDAARRLGRSTPGAPGPGSRPSPDSPPFQGHAGHPAPGTDGDLAATVGQGVDGPIAVDLVEHGPHALVAGTTGAGKSEFLRGWLVTLAEALPPDRLRLVLFDFKGGSTFGPFARLPHTECVVTDLDAEASERVLDALAIELKRREAWLASAGLPDVDSASHLPDRPARLVVAVDEFRVLAEEVPHVLQRLVRIATVGRSLGLHLVLATQRPQGVISPDIRANVSLVVALRTASEHESVDVLGSPLAASLDPAVPGSAYLRIGGGPPLFVRFAPADDAGTTEADRLIGPRLSDAVEIPAPPGARRSFDDRLGAAARGRSRALPVLVPAPLPREPHRLRVSTPGPGILLGLQHDPGGPATALRWDPSDGTGLALVAGAPSELARVGGATLATALSSPALAARSIVLNGLGPGLGHGARNAPLALASSDDPAWAEEVMGAAEAESGGEPVLLWVLGLAAWLGDGATAAGLRREARLLALCQRPGVVPVLGGTRELAGSRWLLGCPTRIYLPCGAGEETTALWPRLSPSARLPGRGVILAPGRPELGTPVQLLVSAEADGPLPIGTRPAWSPPPSFVPGGSLSPPRVARASVTGAAVAWHPAGRAALVLGGPGSGRSAAARLLCASWDEPWAPWTPKGDPPPAHTWALVDDADTWSRDRSYELAERVRTGGKVIATALASSRVRLALAWFNDLDPLRDVVLLGPRSAAEAEAAGWRVAPDPTAPPGRAWLVPPGAAEAIRVQLAAPDSRDGSTQGTRPGTGEAR